MHDKDSQTQVCPIKNYEGSGETKEAGDGGGRGMWRGMRSQRENQKNQKYVVGKSFRGGGDLATTVTIARRPMYFGSCHT